MFVFACVCAGMLWLHGACVRVCVGAFRGRKKHHLIDDVSPHQEVVCFRVFVPAYMHIMHNQLMPLFFGSAKYKIHVQETFQLLIDQQAQHFVSGFDLRAAAKEHAAGQHHRGCVIQ